MTADVMRRRLGAIDAARGSALALCLEAALHAEVLEAIAAGNLSPRACAALARAALTSRALASRVPVRA